ncbi:acyltransferase [Rudanella lutea]|uniref:acyltransferase n=1 Tax=Rudanella lutea TaxID=451374 RepID=UPI00035DC402|nr:acyltransferase [Rudanella lutea]
MKKPSLLNTLYRLLRYGYRLVRGATGQGLSKLLLRANMVEYGANFRSNGVPIVDIRHPASMRMGDNVSLNNGLNYNRIGRQQRCMFVANYGGVITIGNHVGMSGTALICHCGITIGNHVLIGGNTAIYDTDFHPITAEGRRRGAHAEQAAKKPVRIEDDVFIGAHSTILKGVTIGRGAVIGAGSVVSRTVPPYEIWAGNPAKFIKAVDQ